MTFIRFAALTSVPDAQADMASSVRTDASQQVLSASDAQVWVQAQDLLAQARTEAQRIKQQALREREAEKQRGYEEGMAQAQMEQVERMMETAERTVTYFASMEQRIVELVMQALRRVVADFSDTERVTMVVKSGLAVMRNQKQLTLRISPEHADTVRANASHLLETFPGVGMLDIVPDPRLRGDATILESELGVVQASMAQQLNAIEAGFRKVLGSRV
jgi:type III secretion protein L